MAVSDQELIQLIQQQRLGERAAAGQAPDTPQNLDMSDPLVRQIVAQRQTETAAVGQMTDAPTIAPQDDPNQFVVGLGQFADNTQASLYALAQMLGREWQNVPGMQEIGRDIEDYGYNGIQEQIDQMMENPANVAGFTDIESFEDFWDWTASTLGQGLPSIGLVMTGGGIGGAIGKKAVERQIANTIHDRMVRNMVRRGVMPDRAAQVATATLTSRQGLDMIKNGMTRGWQNATLMDRGFARGMRVGAFAPNTLLMTGEAERTLTEGGETATGTAILAGLASGGLEALPAIKLFDEIFRPAKSMATNMANLRHIDDMFPGVPQSVSHSFIRDFAKTMARQGLITEGVTELGQEFIQLASLAYHDPNFDLLSPENIDQLINAYAAGALVGAVTGGAANVAGEIKQRGLRGPARPNIPPFSLGNPSRDDGPDGYPPDFEPADNTLFEEVSGRVDSMIRQTMEPALNTVRDAYMDGVNRIHKTFPGLSAHTAKFRDLVNDAHQEFIESNAPILEDVKRYAREQVQWIYEHAETLTDPTSRREWIKKALAEAQEEVQDTVAELQRRADTVAEGISSRVSRSSAMGDQLNALFPDMDLSSAEADLLQGRSRVLESDPEFTFGKTITYKDSQGKKRHRITRGRSIEPLRQKRSAEKLIDRLMERYPSASRDSFEVVRLPKSEAGPKGERYVVRLTDQGQREGLIEDEIIQDALENARFSAAARDSRKPDAQARQHRLEQFGTTVDIPTLALDASNRKLGAGDSQTIEESFLTLMGHLIDRGIVTNEDFEQMSQKFDDFFGEQERYMTLEKARKLDAEARQGEGIQGEGSNVRRVLAEMRKANNQTRFDRQEITEEMGGDFEVENPPLTEAGKQSLPRPVRELSDADLLKEGKRLSTAEKNEKISAQDEKYLKELRAEQRRRTNKEQKKDPPKPKLSSKQDTVVWMPGSSKQAVQAVTELANRVSKLLSGKTKLRIVNRRGAELMIQRGHEHAAIIKEGLKAVGEGGQAIHYDPRDGSVAYIITDDFATPSMMGPQLWALTHELGHMIHFDTWESLSRADQVALYRAFQKDVKAGKVTGAVLPEQNPNFTKDNPMAIAQDNTFEFKEWMADQFVNWMQNRRAPRNALERFMETVAAKIDQLFDFMKKNRDRLGVLDQTYAEFMDSVAVQMRGGDPSGLRRFFRNEGGDGSSLKKLFGMDENGNVSGSAWKAAARDIPRGLTKAEWKAVQERLTKEYPKIIERGKVMAKWVKDVFYGVYLAPATSTIRSIGKRIPVANELASIFNKDMGQTKKAANYHQRVDLIKGSFMNRYDKATSNLTESEKHLVTTLLIRAERKQDPSVLEGDDKVARAARDVRQIFEDMHKYLREDAKMPVGKIELYFPRIYSREKLIANEDRIIAHLMSKGMREESARAHYNNLVSHEMDEIMALREADVAPLSGQAPGFGNMRNRTSTDPFMTQFHETNLDAIVGNYVTTAAKRGEYNKALGEEAGTNQIGGDSLPKSQWNGKANYERILKQAKAEGATKQDIEHMKAYVEANLGMYGRNDLSDTTRSAMAAVIAYQNMRTLLFTVFASLPDMVGPAIRSGQMRRSFKTTLNNIRDLVNDESDIAEMARAFGQVSSAANQHVLTEYVDNHYMSPRWRKWNNGFFKWTGLNWYTDFTRKMALAVGIDYIKQQADIYYDGTKTTAQKKKAAKALAELGLIPNDVEVWKANGEPVWNGVTYSQPDKDVAEVDQRIAEGLIQFVNESILRPNASQRPIAASSPAYMLVYHLKGFMYAIHDTVLKRLAHNFNSAETHKEMAAAVAPAVAMMALTAIGLELRELITGDDRTDRMDGWDYTWELAERSGLMGIAQLGWDFTAADTRGQAEVAAMLGPTISQAGDLISRPASQTIPKSIPIVSQLPWMRDALRDATPL